VRPPLIKCDYAESIGTWERRNDMTGATTRTLLRVLLAGLGVSAVLIALSILGLGAGVTAAVGERVFDALSGWRGPDSPPWPPTMDNELRFYAALWGAYGVVLLLAARDYTGWAGRVPWLAAVFFVGGAGRAFSWLMIGAPHPFFLLLMTIELALPPLLVLLWWRAGGHRPEAGGNSQT
jgi:Domain of unknown function (DUF4345)